MFLLRLRYLLSELYREARGLPEPPEEPITPETWLKLFAAHADISDDRSAVIMWGSMLESTLEEALKKRLITNSEMRDKLFGGYGPFSTLTAKIDAGFCVGLYNKSVHHDLHVLRKVRNEFAHTFGPVFFSHNNIGELCDRLQTATAATTQFYKTDPLGREIPKSKYDESGLLARTRFRSTIYFLVLLIGQASVYPIRPVRDEEPLRDFLKTYSAFL